MDTSIYIASMIRPTHCENTIKSSDKMQKATVWRVTLVYVLKSGEI